MPSKWTKKDFETATQVWLDSYKANQRYIEATSDLFTIFADGWIGSRRALNEAFDCYRKAVASEHGLKCPDDFKLKSEEQKISIE